MYKVILVLTVCLTDLVGVFVCLSVTACLTDLCGDSKLGNNLAVGVDSSTKAWPELRGVEKIGTKKYLVSVFFNNCCQTEREDGKLT